MTHPRLLHAMTLIELLVSIGVIGVLITILIPAIAATRSFAAATKSLANLRTHAQVATLYAGDYRGNAPFVADPNATYSIARGGGIVMEFEFFESSEAWAVALVDDYYQIGLAEDWSIFGYPGTNPGIYQYSPSFIAKPSFWNMRTRGVGQLGPNRLDSVAFPSGKAIFVELNRDVGLPVWGADGLLESARWGMGFVDGSARRHDNDRMIKPLRQGEGTAYGARFSIGIVGMHTVDGVLGRDVE